MGDESAEVSEERRVDSGGESGLGTVRARAILHAFAPRSRTEGKCRFISYVSGRKSVISQCLGI